MIVVAELESAEPGQGTTEVSRYRYMQDNDILFERISLEHGLSQSTVNCILQDSRGFLWFGTRDGLNRYNGYDFEIFEHDPENPGSLSNNSVLTIYEDSLGVLWVGTEGGGLNAYDQTSGQFEHYRFDPAQTESLRDDSVLAVHEDSSGNLWIGTQSGLDRFDRQTKVFNHITDDALNAVVITSILEDSMGSLWVGTGNGLVQYDDSGGVITVYQNNPLDLTSLAGNRVSVLYEDQLGMLWIGSDGGLSRLNRSSDNFTRYRNHPSHTRTLIDDEVNTIFEEQAGYLWVGTMGGLDRFDRDNDEFVHYTHDPDDLHSLSDNLVLSIYEDREGILWVGTETGGLNKAGIGRGIFNLYQSKPGEEFSLSDNVIRAIYEDQLGDLWIGTARGLDRFDRNEEEIEHYRHISGELASLSDDIVLAVNGDQHGAIWVGTLYGGLNRFDRRSEEFGHYYHSSNNNLSLSNNTVRVIYEDSQGVMWFGTNQGLNRLDVDTEIFDSFQNSPALRQSIIRSIYEDSSGGLWVGTNRGLFEFDRQNDLFHHYSLVPDDEGGKDSSIVMSIFEDRAGNLWLGTYQGGLAKLDRESGNFKHYHKQDGLPSDIVYGIMEDQQGYLWISTVRGLSRFDPETEVFKNYNVDDGLQNNEFSEGAYFQSESGEMFFGGINGLTAFYPSDLGINQYEPPIVLISLTQGGIKVSETIPAENISEVTFSWQENFFEFEFAALSFEQPEKNRYAYILEGFEEQWNVVGNRRFGRYTNLPGGSYTLRIMGTNNDGIWNEEGISIRVNIVPPIWERWWFVVLVGLLIAAVILGGYRVRVRNIQRRSRELEILVDERTIELSNTNQQLMREMNERQRAEDELARQAAEVAVTEERNRLARDLHDAVTQTLFSASLIAEVLPRLWKRNRVEGERRVVELRELTRGALAEMRTLLLELRPAALADAELGDLLEQLAESITGRARVPVAVTLSGECELPPDARIALYRIAQEALNNIAKHAASGRASVVLNCRPTGVELIIQDTGPGFDPDARPPESMGLGIMLERAETIGAVLEIHSEIGQGTQIRVTWHEPPEITDDGS